MRYCWFVRSGLFAYCHYSAKSSRPAPLEQVLFLVFMPDSASTPVRVVSPSENQGCWSWALREFRCMTKLHRLLCNANRTQNHGLASRQYRTKVTKRLRREKKQTPLEASACVCICVWLESHVNYEPRCNLARLQQRSSSSTGGADLVVPRISLSVRQI